MHRLLSAPLALSLAVTGLFLGATLARADVKVRCVQEIDKLCPDSEPGSPERRACVREGMAKLPAECQEWLTQRKPAAQTADHSEIQRLYDACGKDQPRIDLLCPEEQRRGAGLVQCVSAHRSEFSESCVKYLNAVPEAKPASASRPAPAR